MKRTAWGSIILALIIWFSAGSAQALQFEDVSGHWAEQSIYSMAARGIVKGYGDGSFRPEQVVTREELITMAVKMLGLEEQAKVMQQAQSSFGDVADDYWAKGAIEIGREYGLVAGQSNSNFGKKAEITREEMAVILARLIDATAPWDGRELNSGSYFKPRVDYSDKEQIHSWARDSVQRVSRLGIMQGYEDGSFRPREVVTRAQAGVIFNRLLEGRGQAQQFYGVIHGGDPSLQQLEIKINNQQTIFKVAQRCRFFSHQGERDWQTIEIFTPVFFSLNSQGEISFIRASAEFDSIPITIQPAQARETASTLIPSMPKAVSYGAAATHGAREEGAGGVDHELEMVLTTELTGKELNISQLTNQLELSGKGIRVAIVDTGLDPGHPDLLSSPTGSGRNITYLDVTDEGLVELTGAHVKQGLWDGAGLLDEEIVIVMIPEEQGQKTFYFSVPGDSSLEDYLNTFKELTPGEFKRGLEEAIEHSQVAVVGNKSYQLYENVPEVIPIPVSSGLMNVLLLQADDAGEWVKLFFDGNGHGTHVAGIVGAQGRLKGIAPEVELIAVKALNSFGESDVPTLIEGIRQAVASGAQVVNLSLGFQIEAGSEEDQLLETIHEMSVRDGVTFVVAGGNTGPGLNSVAVPGIVPEAITVGAYITPEMWQGEYNLHLPQEAMWEYSSVGPGDSRAFKPDVVAPGVLWSTFPMWTNGYYIEEGTSMAAPQVTGVVALLMEGAIKRGLEPTPAELKRALVSSAKPFTHISPLEQGHGRVDGAGAWQALNNSPPKQVTAKYRVDSKEREYLYLREYGAGILEVAIYNGEDKTALVRLAADVNWIKTDITEVRIPPNSSRRVLVYFDPSQAAGISVGSLKVKENKGQEQKLLTVSIVPEGNIPGQLAKAGSLRAGERNRYFIKVAPGTGELQAGLRIHQSHQTQSPQGRARLHLFDPNGQEWAATSYLGADLGARIPQLADGIRVPRPRPGVWEMVVSSSSWLDLYKLERSEYIVSALGAGNIQQAQPEAAASPAQWVAGVAPVDARRLASRRVECWIFNTNTREYYNGPLLINDRMHVAKEGKVYLQPKELTSTHLEIVLLNY